MLLLLIACNKAPTKPEVAITPAAPTTADDLAAVIQGEASDPDGDPVTYTYDWFADGEPRPDLAGSTVPAAETAKGQAWKVVVTPSDSQLDGGFGQAEVIVQNSLPSATISLDPAAPTAADAVTASALTADLD